MKRLLLICLMCALTIAYTQAQNADTTMATKAVPTSGLTRGDSLYLAKLNSGSNIMLALGVGLCGAGGYLVYNGYRVYTSTPVGDTPGQQEESERQNHKQGTIYLAVGGIAIAGGIVLTALGAKNKIEFKRTKRHLEDKRKLELQGGILDNGKLGIALRF